jgi:general stress protein 26
MTDYCWETSMHLNLGDQRILVQRCSALEICKQTTSQRIKKQGWRSQTIYFFEGESDPDYPTYTLKELLVEAEYRKALRERDLIEQECAIDPLSIA